MKKIIALVLALTFVFALTLTASAADSATVSYDDLKWVAGDVDCNEAIEADDCVALQKILLSVETAQNVKTANVNKDAVIDIRDLVRLKKGLADITELVG